MPFDWKGLLELARDLEKQATQPASNAEACFRSAMSRAYFGAFGHARGYALSFLNFNPRDDVDDHGRLRAHLKGKRRKGDADRLEQLRQWRNEADYLNELPWQNPLTSVATALAQAEKIFTSLTPPKAP